MLNNNKNNILSLFAITFTISGAFGILSPTLMFSIENLGATQSFATQVLAFYSISQFISGPILGKMSDNFGRKPVIFSTMLLGLLCYFTLTQANSLFLVTLSLIGAGICSGTTSVIFATVTDITTPETRSRGIGLTGASIGLGFTIGPFIGGILAASEASNATIYLPAIGSVCLIAVGLLCAITLNLPQTKKDVNSVKSIIWQPISFKILLNSPFIRSCCIFMFVLTCALSMMESTLSFFLQNKYEWGPKHISWLLSYGGLLIVFIQMKLIGPLTDRYGSKNLVKAGIFSMCLGLSILAFSPVYYGIPFGITFVGIGIAIFNTSLLALTSYNCQESERGLTLGTVVSMQSLGRSFGPSISGYLYKNLITLPILTGIVMLLTLLVLTFTPLSKFSQPQPEPK